MNQLTEHHLRRKSQCLFWITPPWVCYPKENEKISTFSQLFTYLFAYDLYLIFYNVVKLFNDECYFFIIRMILQVFSFCQMKMSTSFIVFKYQYICFDLLELGKLNRSCTYSWPGNFQVFEVYIQSLFNLPVVYTCDFAIQGQMTQIKEFWFFIPKTEMILLHFFGLSRTQFCFFSLLKSVSYKMSSRHLRFKSLPSK